MLLTKASYSEPEWLERTALLFFCAARKITLVSRNARNSSTSGPLTLRGGPHAGLEGQELTLTLTLTLRGGPRAGLEGHDLTLTLTLTLTLRGGYEATLLVAHRAGPTMEVQPGATPSTGTASGKSA